MSILIKFKVDFIFKYLLFENIYKHLFKLWFISTKLPFTNKIVFKSVKSVEIGNILVGLE